MDNQKNTIDILLIEDNPTDIFLIREMLANAKGISFCLESTILLKKGLERLSEKKFDVILTDLELPDSRRFETFEQLYSDITDIPIIVLTSHDDEEFGVKAIQSGAQDYLIKGQVSSHLLTRAIRYAIERNRSEKALRESKEEWERTFDSIDDIITILTPDMRIRRANCAIRLLKMDSEEVIGKYCYDIFRNEAEPCPECPVNRVTRRNNSVTEEIEHTYMGRTFQVTLSPMYDENEKFIGFVHIAKDISYKKKMETQLRQTQKMEAIATLAGGIAHDLNNILFPIYGYTEMTMDIIGEGSVARRNLEQVMKAAERARVMVQQILTFSRQREEKKKSPWKIQSIIKEVLKLLRGALPATITIRPKINEACGPVMADPTQIHQIIMNLCTNAYHAMRETGGKLEVCLDEIVVGADEAELYPDMIPGPYLKMSVSDTGHGMDKETIERIFDPYFSTKDPDQGTGLGLSQVHGIVKDHNGHITVYSEPGHGSIFHIYLPVCGFGSSDSKEAVSHKDTPGGHEHILLVDDEEQIVEMISQRLKRLGYRISSQTNSLEALESFRKDPGTFDLLITDMTMPDLTGIGLSREIRNIRPDIPIILCTGFSELITEGKVRDMGIQGYIMKPVSTNKIARLIRKVLKNQEQGAETESEI